MSLAILGLGKALPATRITRDEALEISKALCCQTGEHAYWLPDLYANIGIEARYMAFGEDVLLDLRKDTVLSQSVFLPRISSASGPTTGQRMRHYAEHAEPLALEAARQALDQAGVPADEITHLVTVSCTGFAAPGVDIALIRELGLCASIERTNVGFMGCHGALNGLRVARAFTSADSKACVLLCAVELCGLHFFYGWEPQKMVANALFADGAAAVVGAATGKQDGWQVVAAGSCVFPGSEDAMTWTIGDHGFEMTLSKQVPRLIGTHLRPWLEKWLHGNGLSVDTVASWAVHPGGPRILDFAAAALGLTREAIAPSLEVFQECGNMSSPTILFILDRLRQRGRRVPAWPLASGLG